MVNEPSLTSSFLETNQTGPDETPVKSGDKFGLLTVMGLRTKGVWDCRCICTLTRLVPASKLLMGAVDRCASCHDYHVRVVEVQAQRSGYTPDQWRALETAWLQHIRVCLRVGTKPTSFMRFEVEHNTYFEAPDDELKNAQYESRNYGGSYHRAFENDAVEIETDDQADDDDTAYYELRRRTRA